MAGDNRTKGSVRLKGAQGDPLGVLSQDRVDRWKASSGLTPSSVTAAGVRNESGVRGEGPGWKGARGDAVQ